MKVGYVARQPIFNRELALYGYELLFRGGLENFAPAVDGDTATSELLINTFVQNDYQQITGGHKAFINFTQNLLLQKIPFLFPQEITVVEVLEDVKADPAIVDACTAISQKGYLVALDDFLYSPTLRPLVALADIIKVDFMDAPLEKIEEDVNLYKKGGNQILAEKVESYDVFRQAWEMGFEYFQGYFFAKPEVIQREKLSTPELMLLQLISEVNRPEMSFSRLEKVIARDVTISYKLLRYINSAYFRRVARVDSIKQAVVHLGETEIRRFVSLIAMSQLAKGKPEELIKVSAIRGKFCELLGAHMGLEKVTDELFTLGLFSLIEAILDDRMSNIMGKLPLSSTIQDALVNRSGMLGAFLELIESYEQANWTELTRWARKLQIRQDVLGQVHQEALVWGQLFTSV